jgi:hypothetical protein
MRINLRRTRITTVLVLLFTVVAGVLGVRHTLQVFRVGPRQPIPFSHRVHVADKKISCFFCHQYAAFSDNAGIPTTEKCMHCHRIIIPEFPPIRLLRSYYEGEQQLMWVRVNQVPDFVFFNHAVHIKRGIDCGACHGNVRVMDRIQAVRKMDMDFCLRCHWEMRASTDCYVCHR